MSKERIQRRKLWLQMSAGVRVEVMLLDGRRLEMGVGPRLLTQELLAMVASHFTLRESSYFGLAFKDPTGHYHWLVEDRRLLEHDFVRGVRVLVLHFLVKFFVDSVMDLRDTQTIELYYQQCRSLVYQGFLDFESISLFKLAGLSVQGSNGDYASDSSTKSYLKSGQLLPASTLQEHLSPQYCEDHVCSEHRQLRGLTRGEAILSYMKLVESHPSYGVHYYEVRDRSNLPWCLGISSKGIAQYDFLDKRSPRRVFVWKQLENLYFRDRKFSIEVHDPKRSTSSRRAFSSGAVSIFVWFAETQALCKAIWSMAIAQHQFYLDRKISKSEEGTSREAPDLAGDLSRSCLSLSTHSSSSNLSNSGSHSSLQQASHTDSASTESLHAARMEMVAALSERYKALQDRLNSKTDELRLLCLREGELTGQLPPEYPLKPGEPPPVIRKRVGTSFTIDENLINKIINKQEETVAALELEYEIQAKITSAALRLANESTAKKGVRKQRKLSHQQAYQRLKELENKLKIARSRQATTLSSSTMPKVKKKLRPVSESDSIQDDSNIGLCSLNTTSLSSNDVHDAAMSAGSQSDTSRSSPSPAANHRSAPPSPHRSTVSGTTSLANSSRLSYGLAVNSQSNSPSSRPPSGYIPSGVYTRSQYRTMHYPTLSTRSQSTPGKPHQTSASCNGSDKTLGGNYISPSDGGLYNLPHQRKSLASHSLDNLDSSLSYSSPSTSDSNYSAHSSPHQTNYPHHHHHYNHVHLRKQRNDVQDRYGSLDRRRAATGRLESRSMEHLDSLPQPQQQQHHSPSQQVPYNTLLPHLCVLTSQPYVNQSKMHGLPIQTSESPVSSGRDSIVDLSCIPTSFHGESCVISTAVVDGSVLNLRQRYLSGPGIQPLRTCPSTSVNGASCSDKKFVSSGTVQKWSKNSSGKDHMEVLPIIMSALDQENIPPQGSNEISLQPLKPTYSYNRNEGTTSLRATASIGGADQLRAIRLPASELQPLRATKSSSELPPLRVTNIRSDQQQQQSGSQKYGRFLNSSVSSNESYLSLPSSNLNTSQDTKHSYACQNAFVNMSQNHMNGSVNNSPSTTLVEEPPLISLAEAAKLKKEQKESAKEWYDSVLDSPAGPGCLRRNTQLVSSNELSFSTCSSAQSVHNVSSSSIGSSSSNNSVFQMYLGDGAESLNSTLHVESPQNHMVITTGSFQPSREISKPFEMSDFYKYSTKFRRQSSGSTGGTMEAPSVRTEVSVSPLLPPKGVAGHCIKGVSPSPLVVSHQLSSMAQQKEICCPVSPFKSQPMDMITPEMVAQDTKEDCNGALWENSPLHQAMPVNITTKRAATLV